MADTLSERLREFARHIDDYTRGIDPPLIEEAAAELDRREAIVAAAEAWAKAKRSEQSENWPRSATTLLSSETAEANILALFPADALKG